MFEQSYTYDDIGIVPDKVSCIQSRDYIDPSTDFLGFHLSLPIVVAPMRMVVSLESAPIIHKLGGIACLPRLDTLDKDVEVWDQTINKAIPSIRVQEGVNSFKWLRALGAKAVCIDTANGFHIDVTDLIYNIRQIDPKVKIIAGNVGSVEGYDYLSSFDVDAVRVGVGGGSVCTTSIATGIGVGQASLIREIANWRKKAKDLDPYREFPLIIADGGIRQPADMAKAIALGADVVMVGRIFAGSEESPGEVIKFQGRKYKQYAGEASFAVKRSDKYVEGDETLVRYSGPMAATWDKFDDGIRSAMSYRGAVTLDKFRYLPDKSFRILSSSAGRERNVHA